MLPEDLPAQPISIGQLIALVDSLRKSTLSAAQGELVQKIRSGLMMLSQQENYIEDVKVRT